MDAFSVEGIDDPSPTSRGHVTLTPYYVGWPSASAGQLLTLLCSLALLIDLFRS